MDLVTIARIVGLVALMVAFATFNYFLRFGGLAGMRDAMVKRQPGDPPPAATAYTAEHMKHAEHEAANVAARLGLQLVAGSPYYNFMYSSERGRQHVGPALWTAITKCEDVTIRMEGTPTRTAREGQGAFGASLRTNGVPIRRPTRFVYERRTKIDPYRVPSDTKFPFGRAPTLFTFVQSTYARISVALRIDVPRFEVFTREPYKKMRTHTLGELAMLMGRYSFKSREEQTKYTVKRIYEQLPPATCGDSCAETVFAFHSVDLRVAPIIAPSVAPLADLEIVQIAGEGRELFFDFSLHETPVFVMPHVERIAASLSDMADALEGFAGAA